MWHQQYFINYVFPVTGQLLRGRCKFKARARAQSESERERAERSYKIQKVVTVRYIYLNSMLVYTPPLFLLGKNI